MYFDYISHNNELETKTLSPIVETSSSADATAAKTPNYARNEIDPSIYMLLVWLVFGSIISWSLFKIVQKLATVKVGGLSILPGSQIPCKNCRFFVNDRYLKCAVRPATVLTKQAIDCSDFCSKDKSYLQADCTREVKHGS